MQQIVSPATREFLAWIAYRPRTYAEAMDAWRTSCPRLSAWEDALGDGLIEVASGGGLQAAAVTLTERGRVVLGRESS